MFLLNFSLNIVPEECKIGEKIPIDRQTNREAQYIPTNPSFDEPAAPRCYPISFHSSFSAEKAEIIRSKSRCFVRSPS